MKYFPIKTVSAQSLKFHFERVAMLEGIKPDMIVVDYADILRPVEKDKNSNSYSEMGGIYEELRQVAGELQIPIWSASQTNRSGLGDDVVQAHNVADSYRKIMTADFVMSLSRRMGDKVNNTARFHIIKNRFGPDGLTFYSKMDAGNGDIRIYDEKSAESSNIKSIMENDDEGEGIKKSLGKKWGKFSEDKIGKDQDL